MHQAEAHQPTERLPKTTTGSFAHSPSSPFTGSGGREEEKRTDERPGPGTARRSRRPSMVSALSRAVAGLHVFAHGGPNTADCNCR